MDLLDKLAKIAAALRVAGGSVVGKKKLQKLIFLAQEKGLHLGYDYDFHLHGVYCSELEADLRIAESYGVVSLRLTEEYGNPVEIALNRKAISNSVMDGVVCGDDIRGLNLIKVLKDEPARVLEVLSTIVYLSNEGYKGEEHSKHLHRLKGHLVDYFDQAKKLHATHFRG
jgi:uncharacterized protein YwgA